ncbi:MAG: 2-oxoglutarate dehydrogenase, E2 component, dihydrolipoamide succinyltransferase, partial [Pseudorhodoplanes sp.]|nr:2-oxoglutarate dehydrogenase, E2 component, dihydrolipoamide succinyltransferase [Pseudorhodoplanes sp.]
PVADPASGDPGEDERCDLCAVVQLAGSALLPVVPQPLLLPPAPAPLWMPAPSALRAQAPAAFFHARAPPRA